MMWTLFVAAFIWTGAADQECNSGFDMDAVALLQTHAKVSARPALERAALPSVNKADYREKDNCLIVYHVPKCGGNSLMKFLQDNGLRLWTNYGPLNDNSDLRTIPSDHDADVSFLDADVYMGLWPPGFKQHLRDNGMHRNCYEATVLRKPLDRVSSNLFFWFSGNSTDDLFRVMANGPEYNGDYPTGPGQTVPGNLTFSLFNLLCRQFSVPQNDWHSIYDAIWQNCNVSLAKQVLSSMDSVGFLEDMGAVQKKISELLGFSDNIQEESDVLNGSENPGFLSLPAELKTIIYENNRQDAELYEWAKLQYAVGVW